MIAGRIPAVRSKRAPFGATRSSGRGARASARACASGSMLKVRMIDGYRLRKSKTSTLGKKPGTASSTVPPAAPDTRRSARGGGRTRRARSSAA